MLTISMSDPQIAVIAEYCLDRWGAKMKIVKQAMLCIACISIGANAQEAAPAQHRLKFQRRTQFCPPERPCL
jgi:hypothetical protein